MLAVFERASRVGGARIELRRVLLAAAGLLGAALMLRFELWRCPVAELFELPCPGCGLTRAALALAAFDLHGALALHPLAPLLVPWAALLVLRALFRFMRGAPAALALPRGPALGLLAVLLVGVWAARFFGAFGGPVRVFSHLFG